MGTSKPPSRTRRLASRVAAGLAVIGLASGPFVETPKVEAAPWIGTAGCDRWISMWLTNVNPNISIGYQQILTPGPPPCWSIYTRITANLFGQPVSIGTACEPGFAGKTQYTPGAYGNPWWVTTKVGYSGSGGDCGHTEYWF